VTEYDDSSRLTLGEFAEWSQQAVAEIQRLEALGVIRRGSDGLFVLGPTIAAMADHAEAEEAALRSRYRRTTKGWAMLVWGAPSYALGRLWRAVEIGLGRLLLRIWPLK